MSDFERKHESIKQEYQRIIDLSQQTLDIDAQILKENNSKIGQSGQASQSKDLTTILKWNPSVGQHLEEVVTQAAKQSVSQVIADEREVQ